MTMNGTKRPTLVRMSPTVRRRKTKPRVRLKWVTPSMRIPTIAEAKEREPMMKARGPARLGLNSSDIHAMMEERSTMAQMR